VERCQIRPDEQPYGCISRMDRAARPLRVGLTPEQIDVWEIHEAFSAQALGVLRELPNQLDRFQVPDHKLTPNGVAVAIGHPFNATGARYALTPATELRERHLRYGAIAVCIGSGQGVAMILENPAVA
jgi:acetyl-CoA acetyltransferase